MNKRWKQRPPGSTWGDFGPDDELGRLNLLRPEKVKQGVAEVREGLVFCLSLALDFPGGRGAGGEGGFPPRARRQARKFLPSSASSRLPRAGEGPGVRVGSFPSRVPRGARPAAGVLAQSVNAGPAGRAA